MQRLIAAAALLSLSSTAVAVPLTFTHQGYLADSAGSPLTGSEDLVFALYEDPSGSAALWSETLTVNFDAGVYSVILGASEPLDAEDFSGSPLFLGITVGSTGELPQRLQINSVPYAVRALDATNVRGGVVEATEIRVGGNTVIDSTGTVTASVSWSDLTDIPTSVTEGSDTLADLSCGTDEVAAYDGGAWVCASASGHAHAASDITSGFLSLDRIPVGSGADNVARGNHTHEFADLSGVASASQLPDLDALNGTLSADQLPSLAEQGLVTKDGGSKTAAGKSCKTILDAVGGTAPDGVYWADPQEDGRPIQVWCDMTRNGGGWTLVMQNVAGVETSGRPTYQQTIENVLVRGGTFGENLAGFDLHLGFDFWPGLGTEGRYEVGTTVGVPTKQALFESLGVNAGDKYQLEITNPSITLGGSLPGLFSYHNGLNWSTVDRDQDRTGTDNCEANYDHPFWYGECWSGSIWGSDTGNYTKNAYWDGSGTDYHPWGALWLR